LHAITGQDGRDSRCALNEVNAFAIDYSMHSTKAQLFCARIDVASSAANLSSRDCERQIHICESNDWREPMRGTGERRIECIDSRNGQRCPPTSSRRAWFPRSIERSTFVVATRVVMALMFWLWVGMLIPRAGAFRHARK
jgi:hypothetical protein